MSTTTDTMTCPIGFTEQATSEIKRLYSTLDIPEGNGLRIGVKGGGCSGMSYLLAFDAPTDADQHFEIGGVPVFVNKSHSMYIVGMEVDYQDGLNARGFIFNNPNATSTCGCGTSFSA